MLPRWQERDRLCPPDQVANAKDSTVNLAPASGARADAVKAAWSPFLSGQIVPLIWERWRDDAEPCDDI